MGMAVVICHFFRKFCQDPGLEGEEGEGDIEDAAKEPQAEEKK